MRSSTTGGKTSRNVAFATISSSMSRGIARSPSSGARWNLTGDTYSSGMRVLEHHASACSARAPLLEAHGPLTLREAIARSRLADADQERSDRRPQGTPREREDHTDHRQYVPSE